MPVQRGMVRPGAAAVEATRGCFPELGISLRSGTLMQRHLRCSEGFRGFVAPILGLISGFMAAWAIFAWVARGTVQQVVLMMVMSIVSGAISVSEYKIVVQPPATWSALLSRVFQHHKANASEEDEAAWDGDDDDVGPSAQASGQAALRTGARRAVQRRPISLKAVHSLSIDSECPTPGSEASATGLRRRRSRQRSGSSGVSVGKEAEAANPSAATALLPEPVKAEAEAEAPPNGVESTTASSCRDSESGEAEASSDGAVASGQLGNVQPKAITRKRRSASCGDDSEARDSWSWRQDREHDDDSDFDDEWSFDDDDEGDIVPSFRRSWSEGDMQQYALSMADEDPAAELLYLSSSALQLHQSKEAHLGQGSAEEGMRISSAADVLSALQSRGHRLLGA